MDPTMISVLSAMAAAAWSMWTWKSERQKERDHARDEMAAHFVNSFAGAAEVLQRQLYQILTANDLAEYRREYPQPCEPASPPAIDLLYLFGQFFGWSHLTLRFSPYTRNRLITTVVMRVGEILEDRVEFPGSAFRFNYGDRIALGREAVHPVHDHGPTPVFINVSRYAFEEAMTSKEGARARLFRSRAVTSTLAAIDAATKPEELEGRERLVMLQNLLVDLLNALEPHGGFRLSMSPRDRVPNGASDNDAPQSNGVTVLHRVRGRVRLGVAALQHDAALGDRLLAALQDQKHVKSVRVNVDAASVIVSHCDDMSQAELLQSLVDSVEREVQSR